MRFVKKKWISLLLSIGLVVTSVYAGDYKIKASEKESNEFVLGKIISNQKKETGLTGFDAVYQNNLSIYTNQRSDERMMEYLLMELDNEYAYYINEDIEAVCAEITSNCTTDMEKLQAIHDWICTNLYYDHYGLAHDSAVGVPIFVFNNKGTICEGFANLTASMCREVGIPCKTMEGYKISDFEDEIENLTLEEIQSLMSNYPLSRHAWNEAWVDGRWVLMDNTWDCRNRNTEISQEDITYAPCVQKYFDMSLEEFSKTHLFSSYISYFEWKFDEWDAKNSTVSPSPVVSSDPMAVGSPSPMPTATSSVVTGSSIDKKKDNDNKVVSKPGKVKWKSCKVKKWGKVVAKWKKVSGADGYQVQYARKKSFKGKRTENAYGKSTTLWLKSKKKYFIRVRAYTYDEDYKKLCGKWSSIKKIKTKK